MYIIDFSDRTVVEFNEEELSRLLNRNFGKSFTRKWLFAHDKKKGKRVFKTLWQKKR